MNDSYIKCPSVGPYRKSHEQLLERVGWGAEKKGWEAGEKEREKRKEVEERRKIGEGERREKKGGRMEKKLFSANLTRTKTMTCPPTQTLHTKSPLPYIKMKYRFKKILTYFESEIRTLHLQEDLLTETQTKYLP